MRTLIEEFREMAEDAITEWARNNVTDEGDTIRARYMDDGIVEIERETPIGFERISVRFGVAVVNVSVPNNPTGTDLQRNWGEIPAGWFVKTPGGEFWELLSTRREDGVQHVKVRRPDGATGQFQREPTAPTQVRKGSHGRELDDALSLLATSFGDVVILEDSNE